jgi:hypothetical protein
VTETSTSGPRSADTEERSDPGWTPPVALYLSVLTVLLVVSWQVLTHWVPDHGGEGTGLRFAGQWFWDGWVRWDGGWYVGIADQGYSYVPGHQSSIAFFPGYPLTIRTVGRLIDNIPVGAILTTIACGLASMILFWRWCTARMGRRAAVVAVATLGLYPYAWYLYGAVYGDALFLLLALGAFVLLERDQPVLAGLVGACATATRSVGVAVVVGLVVGVLERRGGFDRVGRWGIPRRVRLGHLRLADTGVLLSIGGLLAWSAWLWHRFGDPFLFASVQEEWGQPSTPRTWFKRDFLAQLFRGDDRVYAYGTLLQGLLAVGVLLLSPAIARRFGLRYGAYTAVFILIPLIGSQDFQGLGRYVLGVFPAFAFAGEILAARPWRWRLVLPSSAGLLLLGTVWFADGRYLA